MKRNYAFTLMELMIVIIIVAILVTLALPVYFRTLERSRMAEAYTQLAAIKNAELAYYNRNYFYTDLLNDLTVDNPNLSSRADVRYFNYDEDIKVSSDGFVASSSRNATNNIMGYNYSIWINQDGEIGTDFYTGGGGGGGGEPPMEKE